VCVFKFLIDIFLFCQVVVRYSSHFPTTSGGSTPPLPMHMHRHCRDLSRFGHMHFWAYICIGRGGVDPPEVVGRLDGYLTTT